MNIDASSSEISDMLMNVSSLLSASTVAFSIRLNDPVRFGIPNDSPDTITSRPPICPLNGTM